MARGHMFTLAHCKSASVSDVCRRFFVGFLALPSLLRNVRCNKRQLHLRSLPTSTRSTITSKTATMGRSRRSVYRSDDRAHRMERGEIESVKETAEQTPHRCIIDIWVRTPAFTMCSNIEDILKYVRQPTCNSIPCRAGMRDFVLSTPKK